MLGGPVGAAARSLLGHRTGHSPQTLGFGLVIVVTTFVSLVIGEIVPKQFALRSPEPIAVDHGAADAAGCRRSPRRSCGCSTATSALIFKLLGFDRESRNHVTAEELHLVVAEAQTAGVLEESERAIISGIVRLADRPVREVMTPRTDVDWIDIACERPTKSAQALLDTPHSRIPVADGSIDNIVGVIQTRDMLTASARSASRSTSRRCASRRRSSPT